LLHLLLDRPTDLNDGVGVTDDDGVGVTDDDGYSPRSASVASC
jgi:hypothetical protein